MSETKITTYFWKYLLYYIISTVVMITIIVVLNKITKSDVPYSMMPLVAIIFAGNILLTMSYTSKKDVEHVTKNNKKISLYFAVFQAVLALITAPVISPVSNPLINFLVIPIFSGLVGFGLCYLSIILGARQVKKRIEALKKAIEKSKDPVKKQRMKEYLKRFD